MERFQDSNLHHTRYNDLAWRSLSRFGDLPLDAESRIQSAVDRHVTAPPSRELIAEGDALNSPRILLAGWAARTRLLKDGRRQILNFSLPGDIFGLSSVPWSRALSPIVSLTPTRYAEIPLLAGTRCCQAETV